MGLFTAFDISASGMTAERYRMDIISENLANMNTTRTEDGTPYRRQVVTFEERGTKTPFSKVLEESRGRYSYFDHSRHYDNYTNQYSGKGVKVTGVYDDTWTEMKMVYDPAHPDADDNGYVTYPNVDPVTEFVNLIDASRGYEANATAFEASKSMAQKGLSIGQG
ncbi:MAG: flagellar basal body rod protein FlgC [Lachnospiraceae bacterium]|nr:flagellar basal body rod protein FlgC [Lachnospiraceae bacterium]